jgi:hypothetical protein
MARSKSTSSSKANGKEQTGKEQTGISNPASAPSVKAVAAETAPARTQPETKMAPAPRKIEVLKTEPRKNLLPINVDDEIRRRAYELYLQRGNASGSEAQDWLSAESEIRQRYHQQSA